MSAPDKRVHTLLTDRAIAGLDEAQQAELRHLLAGATIDPSYESAAAAIELSLMAHAEAMPAAVKAAVLEQASHYWGFMVPRQHQETIGGRVPVPNPELTLDASDDLLLGDVGPESWDDVDHDHDDVDDDDDDDDTESPESIDAAVESGVLESSLTNGRIDKGAKPSESQRGEIPHDLHDLKPGPNPSARRSPLAQAQSQAQPQPQPQPEPTFDPPPAAGSHEDLDPRSVSQSDLGPAASHSDVVRMPVSDSRMIRVATYVSAIAALVMLAIALWLFAHRSDPPDPEDLRTQVEAASDKLEWTFTTKQDPAVNEGAGGSVLWSSEAQTGVLTLHGLEPTGSGETQYQVWIVDKKREGPPVNGGVFDVLDDAEPELQIPIHTKLVIGEPSAFVITVEHAGGVVLSAQERVVMVATGP